LIAYIAAACDERGTRHPPDKTLHNARHQRRPLFPGILWERQQTTQVPLPCPAAVIASSLSGTSRAGQSVSDSRTLGTCQRDLAAAAESPAIRLSHGTTGAVCR